MTITASQIFLQSGVYHLLTKIKMVNVFGVISSHICPSLNPAPVATPKQHGPIPHNWLEGMWALDPSWIHQIFPRGIGKKACEPPEQLYLAPVYRSAVRAEKEVDAQNIGAMRTVWPDKQQHCSLWPLAFQVCAKPSRDLIMPPIHGCRDVSKINPPLCLNTWVSV